ncbi:cell wall hydrolase [Paenibacillus puerhi]|uniref:cell wall hydrolase n=1 Tax=Paenibacillus puerhi TaxID=2692622 RepID=UPI00135A3322|nr:cell wall hydrolase [Paenibacillus puerhi]
MILRQRSMFAVLISIVLFLLSGLPVSQAQSPATLTKGSAHPDVWDLQFRLRTLGYYTQLLDGKYGTQTDTAVKQFQSDYGLASDGIVGEQTWRQLKRFSVNQKELDVLAKVIYGEARGEPFIGQVAVGAVVMNRLQSDSFPNTISDVVFQPGAFTAVDDGQYGMIPDRTAYLAALEAVKGWDPTKDALYYFNPATATSKWIWSRTPTITIGRHIFAI